MLRPIQRSALLLVYHLMSPAAAAQAAPDEPAVQQVTVSATRDPEMKSYRAFSAGVDAFEESPHVGPDVKLRFLLSSLKGGQDLKGVSLQIAAQSGAHPVKIDTDGTFALPRIAQAWAEAADMLVNRRKGTVRWRPDVHSPHVPLGARRLGDLRAECAVRWAVEKDELPLLMRTVFAAAGGPCESPSIRVLYLAPKTVVQVVLVADARRVALSASNLHEGGKYYSPPLHDRDWPDETLIYFE